MSSTARDPSSNVLVIFKVIFSPRDCAVAPPEQSKKRSRRQQQAMPLPCVSGEGEPACCAAAPRSRPRLPDCQNGVRGGGKTKRSLMSRVRAPKGGAMPPGIPDPTPIPAVEHQVTQRYCTSARDIFWAKCLASLCVNTRGGKPSPCTTHLTSRSDSGVPCGDDDDPYGLWRA